MRFTRSNLHSSLITIVSLVLCGAAVGQAQTTLASSQNPSVFGQSVTLTATAAAGATGRVTFYDGTSVLGTRVLVNNTAVMSTTLLPSGAHSLTAYYSGDGSHAANTSAGLAQTVNPVSGYGLGGPLNFIATAGVPFGVAVGDFDGDGKTDVVVASAPFSTGAGDVSVLLGRGDGTLQPPTKYAAGTFPYSVAVGDLNADGKSDLVVANTEGSMSVLLGNGNGTFQAAVNYPAGSNPQAVVLGDFNADGKLDAAVINYAANNVGIYLGNGDGTFPAAVTYQTDVNPYAIAVSDFNGDGKADLAIANSGSKTVTVHLGNGDGTFQARRVNTTDTTPNAVAVGDFNGDGKADLAVANYGGANVSVILGNGDGTFKAAVNYPVMPSAISIATADFDGDGKIDLAVAGLFGNTVMVLGGVGDGTFRPAVSYGAGTNTKALAVADFNGDGRADLAVANHGSGDVSILQGIGAVQLKFTTQPLNTLTGIAVPVVVQLQDANGNAVAAASAPVTLTSNPAAVTVTVNSVNGVATPGGSLVFNTPGTFTLTASVPGLTPVTSSQFTITSALPTVVIDAPVAGTVPSGNVVVSGWAIDSTNFVGTAISTVRVLVDGALAGNATYGLNRPDVCASYPGRPGCPNVGYTFTLTLTPGPHNITVAATDTDGSPDTGSASVLVTAISVATTAKAGIFRTTGNTAFLEDSNGNFAYDAGADRFFTTFTAPGGFVAGDIPVAGDWTGDGVSKVGIYRPSTGQWFLDRNNDGQFGAQDLTYSFGGLAGDMPFVGDWMGLGKSCVGIYRSNGSVWLLDLNCNGVFENTPTDAFFPFGGLAGDVPVVGAWTGGTTRVGVVRKYAPGGIPQGNPFLWVLDAGTPNAGNAPANHPAAAGAFAFGGLAGDVFLTGDFYGTGTSVAAVYRAGSWVVDAALPTAGQAGHLPGLIFNYGGLAGDIPIVGRW